MKTTTVSPMTEAEFQQRIVDLAHRCGWIVAHFRPARVGDRWQTPVGYDGAGFPDLVVARGGRVMCFEVKTDSGALSPKQARWLNELGGNGYVVRPKDWDLVVRILTAPRPAAA